MEKNRDQQLLLNARQKLEEELSDLEKQLKEQNRKELKLKKFLKEKSKEIQEITKNIKKMARVESQSKGKIDKNIDLLKSLIDSIDIHVTELQEKMIKNSEIAIEENISDFQSYVNDLQDIMSPLGESKSIKNQEQLSQTVIGIAMTLEMLSENIEDSIESMSELIQKANADALQKSSKDFDDFLLSVQKIFNTFNNILQQLKLVNSIKKYLDLEEIYSESNQILDNLEEIQKKKMNIQIHQENRKEELNYLEKFGMSKNLDELNSRKDFLKQRFDEIQSKYNNSDVEYAKLSEKYEFTVQEKETIRDWFEALTDEVISQQNIATDTYNEMFATLDSIDSTINFIKADIRNASEREIIIIINEFTTYANTFGKMVGIIKKIEKTTNLSNMQKGIKVINGKSKIYIEKISKIVKKLSKQVKNSNIKAIDESFGEFDSFIENFKDKFHIIQDAVSAITLTSSGSLIGELSNLSDDQIKGRQNLLKSELELLALNTRLDFIKKQIQGVENEIKLYSDKGKTDLKRRKVLKIRKSILEGDELLSQRINWKVSNAGIVPFEDFTISDHIPKNIIESDATIKFKTIETSNLEKIIEWNIKKLNKQDSTEIQYSINGFSIARKKTTIPLNNISTPKSFRFRNIAKPVSLKIIERDGEGAIILTNLSEKNRIWNISIQFEKTSDIINIPNSLIKGLKPQDTFTKKYFYKKAGALKPINFICETKHEIGLNLQRSKEKINEYQCEVFFENISDFLIHLNSIELYRPNKTMKSVIKTKPNEKLRPKMDYRHNFTLNSRFDPPRLLIKTNFTLQLVYEYDRESRVILDNLIETPELELEGKTAQSIKVATYKPKKIIVYPEIQKIDSEIESIRDQMKDLELKLKNFREQILMKQESKRKFLKKVEKEKLNKKTTRKRSSVKKSTKKQKKKPKK
ncbi:hypothetical protein DSAG12_01461 [Promethearchaeum syntrophicum]|uniref:Uncharacterized protein n=1 Tax=Promethearchaeum syntrophicum TaxID=2594042 RepID=A0A5B9D9K3_9ARCH|nr:hypothetical protein [Candidatus Prometheoarchaeum syntrophicum]QEE15635.1 hypothetical protein DSAG12_01461 [Candidatus Prometheoarchaeum syntrophicum]